jgi:hypothetical protein
VFQLAPDASLAYELSSQVTEAFVAGVAKTQF